MSTSNRTFPHTRRCLESTQPSDPLELILLMDPMAYSNNTNQTTRSLPQDPRVISSSIAMLHSDPPPSDMTSGLTIQKKITSHEKQKPVFQYHVSKRRNSLDTDTGNKTRHSNSKEVHHHQHRPHRHTQTIVQDEQQESSRRRSRPDPPMDPPECIASAESSRKTKHRIDPSSQSPNLKEQQREQRPTKDPNTHPRHRSSRKQQKDHTPEPKLSPQSHEEHHHHPRASKATTARRVPDPPAASSHQKERHRKTKKGLQQQHEHEKNHRQQERGRSQSARGHDRKPKENSTVSPKMRRRKSHNDSSKALSRTTNTQEKEQVVNLDKSFNDNRPLPQSSSFHADTNQLLQVYKDLRAKQSDVKKGRGEGGSRRDSDHDRTSEEEKKYMSSSSSKNGQANSLTHQTGVECNDDNSLVTNMAVSHHDLRRPRQLDSDQNKDHPAKSSSFQCDVPQLLQVYKDLRIKQHEIKAVQSESNSRHAEEKSSSLNNTNASSNWSHQDIDDSYPNEDEDSFMDNTSLLVLHEAITKSKMDPKTAAMSQEIRPVLWTSSLKNIPEENSRCAAKPFLRQGSKGASTLVTTTSTATYRSDES